MLDYASKELTLEPPFRTDVLELNTRDEPVQPILPTTYRSKHHMVQLVTSDLQSFLESELNVQRLNCIHKWLWLAGLPTPPRPLHYQALKRREIVVAEQLHLHLVWSPSRIFVKPLSRFLLSTGFWRANICPSQHLYRNAFGFIMSYVALIEREIDYNMAINHGLIPKEITWPAWLKLAEEIMLSSAQMKAYLSDPSSTSFSLFEPHMAVNPRFFYGELRVGRLNWIYRLVLRKPRGYWSGCTTYGAFVRDNINSLITLFAYTTIVLSAMQVGLATQWLVDDYAFGMASYVFSIFSIVAPLTAIAAVLGVFCVIFTVNLLRTLRIRKKRRRQGAGV